MNLAIYTTDFFQQKSLIAEIKNYINKDYVDMFICTPVLNDVDSEYASLHPFYLSFFDGTVVFLNVDDYVEYKDKIIGSKILFIDINNNVSANFNKSMFKDCTFLIHDESQQLTKVNNYVVRQT